MKIWRRTIAVVSTFALLLNSLSAPIIVLAQTTTPEPTSAPTDSPLSTETAAPTETPTTAPDATIEPTSTPTTTPDASPTVTVAPSPDASPAATDSASPTPSDQPVQNRDQNSNPTTAGPPSDSNQPAVSEPSASPLITPIATPISSGKEETITTTIVATNIFPSTVQNDIFKLITDKLDYSPIEIAVITGSDFNPNKTYSLTVSSADDPATSTTVDVTTDIAGSFTYNYQLDGNYRPNYKVEAKDGEFLVASTSFTDSGPDLNITKTNNASDEVILGNSFVWTIVARNIGSNDADFDNGENILVDNLPLGPTYSVNSVSASNVSHSDRISCTIVSSNLTCVTTGNDVIFDHNPDGTLTIAISVTPATTGTLDNPRSGGQCKVDPNNVISESNGSNNSCSNDVEVISADTIRICHASSSDSNPFVSESPNIRNDGSLTGGHLNHTGPLYPIDDWGDIIPPYHYGSFNYSGLNWPAGQSIWDNGCVIPPPSCDSTIIYEKTGDFDNSEINIDFINNVGVDGNPDSIKITAKTGYELTKVELTVEDDSHGDFYDYSSQVTSGVTFNPNPGKDIDKARVTIKRICTPLTGTITIVKDSQPDDPDDITFYLTGSVSDFFNLDDDSDATLPNTDTFTDLTAGTYTVREDFVPTRWTPSTITCSDDNSHGNLPTAPTATVNLAAGEDVTCTFTNIRKTGTLIVKKVVVGSNESASNFSFQIDGGTAQPFEADGQNELTVKTYPYTITEPTVVGYTTTYDNCNDVWVYENQSTTCTITNTRDAGNITFEKQIVGTPTDPNVWTFNITGTNGNFTAKNGDTKSLPLGTYTITESGGPTNYHWFSSSGVCSGPDGSDGTLTVTSNGGICTIVNKRDVSAFTAQKLDENNQPIAGWKFKLNDDGWVETDSQGQVLFGSLETGNYTVTEESRSGSYLSEVTSTGNLCQKIESNNNSATVTVPYSVNPVCVFKNVPIPKYEGSDSCPIERPIKKLIGTHTISSADANGEVLSEVLNGNSYLFEASGTFSPTSAPGYVSDAAYTWLNGLLASQYGISGTPPDYGAHALLADLGGGMGIVNWGVPNNGDHTYGFYYTPTLSSPQFVIGDRWSDWYGTSFDTQAGMYDNTGDLTLNVYSCEQSPVKVVATKVVCDNEADLPNWGNHGASIGASTAQDYVDSHPGCHIEPDWQFQYAPSGGSYGDFQTNASALDSPWTTFSGSVDVDPTILDGKIEVREVISDNTYIGFTNDAPTTSDPHSAEIYCNGDVYNYDNWEWINNPQPGNTYYCVAFNAKNYGSVTVTKYNDLDQDGVWDQGDGEDGEPTLNDWDIVLDETTQPTVGGETTFSNLTPGNHSLNEILQGGYIQTNIQCFYDDDRAGQFEEDGYFVNVIPGENVQCYIGNFQERPEVSISKTNNRGGGMNAGNTVDYSLTLTNTGNINISDITIQDILPGGFTYVAGSTTGEISSDPSISGSVLTWSGFQGLGTGGSITIHYQAVSASDLADGLYVNFATCRASKGYDNFKASNVESREVECDSANSTVKIGNGISFSGSLGGQVLGISTVLGASTILPATGSSTTLLVVALTALGVGLFLRMYDVKITRKSTRKVVRSAEKKGKKHAKK